MEQTDEIKLSISCITYNHAPYIRQCLEGFLMQKTDFAFEVLIHDDCSTDGTTEIIREYETKYPDIIKPIYEQENQYQQGKPIGTAVWNLPRARGKYIAFCEGDDYWVDPFKLQKQIDFLENNPDYGMCYTMSKTYFQKDDRFGKPFGGERPNTFESYAYENRVPTQSVVIRKDAYNRYINEIEPSRHTDWKMSDYPIYLWMAYNSKIHFIPEVTAIYRILDKSASHFSQHSQYLKFRINAFEISKFFTDLYNPSLSKIPYERILWHRLEMSIFEHNRGDIIKIKKEIDKNQFQPKSKLEKLFYNFYFMPRLITLGITTNRKLKKSIRNLLK